MRQRPRHASPLHNMPQAHPVLPVAAPSNVACQEHALQVRSPTNEGKPCLFLILPQLRPQVPTPVDRVEVECGVRRQHCRLRALRSRWCFFTAKGHQSKHAADVVVQKHEAVVEHGERLLPPASVHARVEHHKRAVPRDWTQQR